MGLLRLLVLSVVFTAVLVMTRVPAAFLLGPMLAALLVARGGFTLTLPRWGLTVAQALVGLLISRSLTHDTLGLWADHLVLFSLGTAVVLGLSALLGWTLTRLEVMPGSAAMWGAAPGAASAMVLLAEANGDDPRLVALMQYVRVVVVSAVAAFGARLLGAQVQPTDFFPPVTPSGLGLTLALTAVCVAAARVVAMPATPLILGMVLGAPFMVELPPWLLALGYAYLGWSVGLRFTVELVRHAVRALPAVVLANVVLVLACLGVAWVMGRVAGLDTLALMLAMSPGGADTAAAIATSVGLEVPFIVALQMLRFAAVVAGAQWLAKKRG